MKWIGFVLVFMLVWSLWGYLSSNVEQAKYVVVEKKPTYEIRYYEPHIVAKAIVDGPMDESINQGFRTVAGYIFGGNDKKEHIAMTAPVVASMKDNKTTISFGMPEGSTLETLPHPSNPKVEVVEQKGKKVAVIQYSWFSNEEKVKKMESVLREHLKKDGIKTVGGAYYAGYNPPWTPPWMKRHEVMIEVSSWF